MINISDVHFKWSDGSVLTLPSILVNSGERVFVQGPSGSGKSTLLNAIAGLILPDEGKIEVAGTNLMSLNGAQRDLFRNRNIGVVFQQFNLLPFLTVDENILMALHFSNYARSEREAYAQKRFGLLEYFGLDTYRNKATNKLSVGQQQRVALCRALLGEPKIILADEPTSALDEKNTSQFMTLLLEQCEKCATTLVFVSHNGSLASYFDRTIKIETSVAGGML